MDLFENFRYQVNEWLSRRHAQQTLTSLALRVADMKVQTERSDMPFASLAVARARKAEKAYNKALDCFAEDEAEKCAIQCERAILHLRLAEMHLHSTDQLAIAPKLGKDGPRDTANQLSESIATFKMSVEYNNALMSDSAHERLQEVVRMLLDAIQEIKGQNFDESKRIAECGLLSLYLLVKETEIDNRQTFAEIKIPPRMDRADFRRIKELADKIIAAKKQFAESGIVATTTITKHVTSACEHYASAIQALMDDEEVLVRQLATLGALEVRMAERLFKTNAGAQPHPDEQFIEEGFAYEAALKDFRRNLKSLQRLVHQHCDEPLAIKTRLEAVHVYYMKACMAASSGDLAAAERSARAAHLDLDFAWQLINHGVATYSDL